MMQVRPTCRKSQLIIVEIEYYNLKNVEILFVQDYIINKNISTDIRLHNHSNQVGTREVFTVVCKTIQFLSHNLSST